MVHVRRRSGLTLIELLVVVSVIGLLIALLLPAAQSAREAARRLQCMNNLKQLSLAIEMYGSTYESLPSGGSYYGYSLHTALLPGLEQGALYNCINFDTPAGMTFYENTTLTNLSFSTFWCPSDPLAGPTSPSVRIWPGMTNYAGCMGDDRIPLKPNGMFTSGDWVARSQVTDGMSNTVAMSEFLVGRRDGPERLRSSYIPDDYDDGPALDIDAFTARCRDLRGMSQNVGTVKGSMWFMGQRDQTLYNHVMPMNTASCVNTKRSRVAVGATTASSRHPGGVHCLFGDGHVKFLADGMDLAVWRSISTRDGGEASHTGEF